jgi:hypothetical protein
MARVRVLEARFHPRKRPAGEFYVVGHVYCWGRNAKVLPAPARAVDGAMMNKLRYIVRLSGEQPYEWLSELASEFWSFVDARRDHSER